MDEGNYSIELVCGPRGQFKGTPPFQMAVRREIEAGRMTTADADAIMKVVAEAFGYIENPVKVCCLCCGRMFESESDDSYCDECAEAGCLGIPLGDENTPCQVTGAFFEGENDDDRNDV